MDAISLAVEFVKLTSTFTRINLSYCTAMPAG